MKKVKFVGGPFHGSEHEVADDIVELRLPVLSGYSLRYVAPNPDEFVFVSKDLNEQYTPADSILQTPDKFISRCYIFELVKLDKKEWRGRGSDADSCEYKIVVRDRSHREDTAFVTTFKLWSWYDHYSVELANEHKYDVSYIDTKNTRFDADFIYGLGKLLEQNGFVR